MFATLQQIVAALLLLLYAIAMPPAATSSTTPVRAVGYGATVSEKPIAPDGTPIQLDLPLPLHTKNCGGSDGSGLCVFTSIGSHAACWQNVESLQKFQDFMKRHPGGGYPEKVDKMIDQFCKEQNKPKPRYVQIQSGDLEILKLACKTGRMPSVTYGFSPSGRYGGAKISHMVSLLHADDKWFCVLDNNFPRTYEWMTPAEFSKTYTSGGRAGWTHLLLDPGPPPCPKN